MLFRLLVYFALLIPVSAFAGQFRTDAALGFTNNAYLTSESEKSDLFLKATGTYSWQPEPTHTPRLRLAYTDFFEANGNDMFAWSVLDRWSNPSFATEWTFEGGLFGRHYTSSSPGVTEESFSHIGTDFKAEKMLNVGPKTEFTWGPNAELRKYIQGSNRMDITGGAGGALEHEAREDLTLGALANAGVIFSNQSEYSRIFLDLGGSVDFIFSAKWNWYSEISLRQTYFTSRTVDQVTATTQSRGRKQASSAGGSTTVKTNEKFSGFTIFSQMVRQIDELQRVSGEVTISNQSSESGYQDYSAAELMARWTLTF